MAEPLAVADIPAILAGLAAATVKLTPPACPGGCLEAASAIAGGTGF